MILIAQNKGFDAQNKGFDAQNAALKTHLFAKYHF